MKSINFYDNQLRNESGTALIESLRKNKNILQIQLKYNRVQLRVLEEINKLLKQNGDNYKKKYIPNLKKEIKMTFITENDFKVTNNKIQETGINVGNV
jgi:ribosomal protein S8